MRSPPRFGVYLHWPYCARICPYCDFNVYRDRGEERGALLRAIADDLAAHRARIGPRSAETVFLGGGTPSLLSGAEIATLIAAVDRVFPLAGGAEVTLEANPEDRARFPDFVAAGVNRLSIGVQSLRDDALAALFRTHDAAAGVAAVEAAARTGARVSADLIYARMDQTLCDWRAELGEALLLPIEHLSLYQLTIEEKTAFARAAGRGRLRVPHDDLAADFYALTQELCDVAGLPAYEISNHARGVEARARHNVLYWTGGEWVGVGPGAHGRILMEGARWATEAAARPRAYIDAVSLNGVGWMEAASLSAEAVYEERVLMGLRLAEGVALPDGVSRAVLAALRDFLVEEDGRVRLTAAGRLVADRVAHDLLA